MGLKAKKQAPDICKIWWTEDDLPTCRDCQVILKSSNGVHTNRALQFTYHTERRQAASALRYRSSKKLCSSVFYITRREMSLLTAWPVKIYLYPAVEETLFHLNKTIYINTTIYISTKNWIAQNFRMIYHMYHWNIISDAFMCKHH